MQVSSLLPSDTNARLKHSLQPEEVEIWTAACFWGSSICVTTLLLAMASSCVEIILECALVGQVKTARWACLRSWGWLCPPTRVLHLWEVPHHALIAPAGCSHSLESFPSPVVALARPSAHESCRVLLSLCIFFGLPWLQEPLLQLFQAFCAKTSHSCRRCHYRYVPCWLTNVSLKWAIIFILKKDGLFF